MISLREVWDVNTALVTQRFRPGTWINFFDGKQRRNIISIYLFLIFILFTRLPIFKFVISYIEYVNFARKKSIANDMQSDSLCIWLQST